MGLSTARRAGKIVMPRHRSRLSGETAPNVTPTTAENYADTLADRVSQEQLSLATRWLDELKALVTVGSNEVFPSRDLLDHIPALIGEVAAYLRAPAHEEI